MCLASVSVVCWGVVCGGGQTCPSTRPSTRCPSPTPRASGRFSTCRTSPTPTTKRSIASLCALGPDLRPALQPVSRQLQPGARQRVWQGFCVGGAAAAYLRQEGPVGLGKMCGLMSRERRAAHGDAVPAPSGRARADSLCGKGLASWRRESLSLSLSLSGGARRGYALARALLDSSLLLCHAVQCSCVVSTPAPLAECGVKSGSPRRILLQMCLSGHAT